MNEVFGKTYTKGGGYEGIRERINQHPRPNFYINRDTTTLI